MNREPINTDDPQLTAYLLGELDTTETAEFEALFRQSPNAQAEADGLMEVMDFLSDGLKAEWETVAEEPQLQLLEASSDNVVQADFGTKKKFAGIVAAGLAAAIAVGAFVMVDKAPESSDRSAWEVSQLGSEVASEMQVAERSLTVPQLVLEDEVEDMAAFDLVEAPMSDRVRSDIDASYLESEIVPASYSPRVSNKETGRVDSYLPAVQPDGFTTGMIESRLRDRMIKVSSDPASVVVRGYVTMDGEAVRAGFNPVGISGNPVVHGEEDIRVLAELNRLQHRLSDLLSDLPSDSQQRAEAERILEHSREISGDLKTIFTR